MRRATWGHQELDAGTCGMGTWDVKNRDAGTLLIIEKVGGNCNISHFPLEYVYGERNPAPYAPYVTIFQLGDLHLTAVSRAQNDGWSSDNVQPDCGLDRSNSRLAGHFDRSFLDANIL